MGTFLICCEKSSVGWLGLVQNDPIDARIDHASSTSNSVQAPDSPRESPKLQSTIGTNNLPSNTGSDENKSDGSDESRLDKKRIESPSSDVTMQGS